MNFKDWYDGARQKSSDDPAKQKKLKAEWERVLKAAGTTANTLAYYRSSGRTLGVSLGLRLEDATANSSRKFLVCDELGCDPSVVQWLRKISGK